MDGKAFMAENRQAFEAFAHEMERHILPVLAARVDPETAEHLLRKAWEGFDQVLEEMPYIGDDNPLIKNLAGAAYEMNVYRQLEAYGLALRDISRMVQTALLDMTRAGLTAETVAFVKNEVYAPQTLRQQAERSQKRRYAGDWVFACVMPGPHDHWDVGVNYTECGIVKLFKKYGCERYVPFVCLNDYPMLHELGMTLERSRTLGNGASVCDFRLSFTQGARGVVTDPDRLPEFGKADG